MDRPNREDQFRSYSARHSYLNPPDYFVEAYQWMSESLGEGSGELYGSAFDLAVDCCDDLNLYDDLYAIPVYVVEIAELLMGSDDGKISQEEKKLYGAL